MAAGPPRVQRRRTGYPRRRGVFATNTTAAGSPTWRSATRVEVRVRGLKETGMTNLPLQAFAKNQIWLELAYLAHELLTWTQPLAFHDHPTNLGPKRLRLRLLTGGWADYHHRPGAGSCVGRNVGPGPTS